jgi:hypothetical protein
MDDATDGWRMPDTSWVRHGSTVADEGEVMIINGVKEGVERSLK